MKFSPPGVALVCLLFLLAGVGLRAQSPSDGGSADSTIVPAMPANPGPAAESSLGGAAGAGAAAEAPARATLPEAAPIAIPGGYGGAVGSVITPGEGRFAQPPIHISISLSQGYDDNVFSTPDNPAPPVQQYSLALITKRKYLNDFINIGQQGPIQQGQFILVSSTQATPLPLTPTQPKVGSMVTRANLLFETQAANPRTAYTFNIALGAMEYYDRPGDTLDYNGNIGFLFYHSLTPRMNFTATGGANSSSQANYGNLYGPTNQNPGQYITAHTKLDLTYQLTPRIATDFAYNLDTTLYQETAGQINDLYNNTLGAEFRYMVSPRIKTVFNYRYSSITYPNAVGSASTEQYYLLGADFDLSQRIHYTFRTGAQSKSYTQSQTQGLSSPYFESGLTYIYGKGSSLNWTTRYGFEETPSRDSSQKTVSFRTGLNVNQVLTARISANLGLNFNRITTSSNVNQNLPSTDQDELSLGLGLNYVFNPHLSFNLSYTYNQLRATAQTSDYSRNQTFMGANYSF